MTAIEHPVWCDRALCTAPAEQPAEYLPEQRYAHRSAPVEGFSGSAYLVQAVAPSCAVYLWVDPDYAVGSVLLELAVDSPLLTMIRQHAAEEGARYPSLLPPLTSADPVATAPDRNRRGQHTEPADTPQAIPHDVTTGETA